MAYITESGYACTLCGEFIASTPDKLTWDVVSAHLAGEHKLGDLVRLKVL